MGRAKEIIVKVIPAKIANEFVKKHPFEKIDEMGAGMYKGEKITLKERKKKSDTVDSNANFNLDD